MIQEREPLRDPVFLFFKNLYPEVKEVVIVESDLPYAKYRLRYEDGKERYEYITPLMLHKIKADKSAYIAYA